MGVANESYSRSGGKGCGLKCVGGYTALLLFLEITIYL